MCRSHNTGTVSTTERDDTDVDNGRRASGNLGSFLGRFDAASKIA
jgi:hypothetical protein